MRRPPSSPVRRHRLLGRRDDGQANVLLLFGMTLGLLALTVLFVRVGAANDLRSRAQTAADAAVLAAVAGLRDQAARELADGVHPMPRYDEEVAESRARTYARDNGAVLTDIRASDNVMGRFGNIVRVEVRGALCQKELSEDGTRAWNDVVCDGEEDSDASFRGTAAAIAIIDLSADCGRDDDGLVCDGRAVTDQGQASALFDVHLVDQEGRYRFDPNSVFGGGAITDCGSLGGLHPQMCAAHEALNREFPGFYLSAGGYRDESGSDHGYGEAVDYMMAEPGGTPTPEMDATAIEVIDFLIANAGDLNVKGIIYDHHIWSPSKDLPGRWMEVRRPANRFFDDPTLDHVDHIHLSAGPPPFR
ncbi:MULTISPECIES: pilus assembly protein TadG-related protein [unclassified Nocardiopsis]|uniref:pilus assembly protein TadG-related protein n=1 Tax=unclassified Nocardiopsis TaxID=2649073 RepID=UPI00340AD482